MTVTFITPTPFHPPPLQSHRTWRCNAKPPETPPPLSNDNLSEADRRYIEKVRAKLTNVRKAAAAARGTPPEQPDIDSVILANLPDNLDELDDIIFNRGPLNAKQVKLFGAWLDEAVAGRKANDPNVKPQVEATSGQFSVDSFHKMSLSKEQAIEKATIAFNNAMRAFNKGQYREAVDLYQDAVDYVGVQSRLGGQYQLWYAQALDAAGEKGRAAKMLEALRTHGDPDVRKVSRELLFIITAPKLELEPGTFLDIPTFEDDSPSRTLPILSSSFGPLRTALVHKKPEPHTLEWYMEKERPPKMHDNSRVEAAMVAAAIGFTLAYMFASHPT